MTIAGCAIDQVLVGPGGVFAVETKWTNEPLHLTDTFFDDHAARRSLAHIREGAARLGLELRSAHGLRCEVTPLLLLSGPGKPAIEAALYSEGVLVAPGQLLPHAITMRPRSLVALDVQAIAAAVCRLAEPQVPVPVQVQPATPDRRAHQRDLVHAC
ncbi:MAG: hypothetical protein Q7V88_07705 [Actinomycetota bacterium]|nr:hypothetical protein [Actinomycetota bacterium]